MRGLSSGSCSALRLVSEGERHREMSANSKSLTITGSDLTRREVLATTAVAGGALIGGQLMPGVISPTVAQGTGAGTSSLNVVLRVNGTEQRLAFDARTTLLDALREHLH